MQYIRKIFVRPHNTFQPVAPFSEIISCYHILYVYICRSYSHQQIHKQQRNATQHTKPRNAYEEVRKKKIVRTHQRMLYAEAEIRSGSAIY